MEKLPFDVNSHLSKVGLDFGSVDKSVGGLCTRVTRRDKGLQDMHAVVKDRCRAREGGTEEVLAF